MSRVIFNEDHPCFGKSCEFCETCRFDEPIPDTSLRILPRCNDCGYLIKQYTGNGSFVYNASCAKHMIMTENVERPRIIQRNIVGKDSPVYRPDWCPKIGTVRPEPTKLALPAVVSKPGAQSYDQYVEKRRKMMELPSVMDWKEINVGDICIVPRLLKQNRKLVLVKERSDYVLKCVELDEELKPKSSFVNIYSNDIDVKFIVKIHKF